MKESFWYNLKHWFIHKVFHRKKDEMILNLNSEYIVWGCKRCGCDYVWTEYKK